MFYRTWWLLGMLGVSCLPVSQEEVSSNNPTGDNNVMYGKEVKPSDYPSALFWGPYSKIPGRENTFSDGCICAMVGTNTCITAAHCIVIPMTIWADKEGKEVDSETKSDRSIPLFAKEVVERFKAGTLGFSNAQDTAVDDSVGTKVIWRTKVKDVLFSPGFETTLASKLSEDAYKEITYLARFPDVAILVLQDSPLEAMPGLRSGEIDTKPVVEKENLTFAGYGCQLRKAYPARDGVFKEQNYDGKIRSGTSTVSGYFDVLQRLGWSPKRARTRADQLSRDYLLGNLLLGAAFKDQPDACYGDSGGPLFRLEGDNESSKKQTIVGITSGGFNSVQLGLVTIETKLDVEKAFQQKLRPEFIKDPSLMDVLIRFTSLSDGPTFQTGTWLKSLGNQTVKIADNAH